MVATSGFFGLGFVELLILLAVNGGLGVPLGIPPEKPDPLLARVAPDECLFYTTWAGMAAPDPASGNQTEQMLAEPEVQRALAEAEKVIQKMLRAQAERSGDPQAARAAEMAPKWAKLLLTRPAAVFVSKLAPAPRGVDLQGGMVVNVGQQAGPVKRMLMQLQADALGQEVKTIEVDGVTCWQLRFGPDAPLVTWGIHGKYLVVGVGQKSVERILASARTAPPNWLIQFKRQLPVQRLSTVTYVNLPKVIDLLAPFGRELGMAEVIELLGLGNLRSYCSVTGLDDAGFVYRRLLALDGPPAGLMKQATAQPLTFNDLQSIPADASLAVAMRLDAKALFDLYREMIGRAAPRAADEIASGIQEAERELGFSIRDELLASLGDVWYLYASPSAGGLITGWTAVVQIRDRRTLDKVHRALVDQVRAQWGQAARGPKIKQFRFDGHQVFYLTVPGDDVPFLPSWCLTPNELVFGFYPQAVKAHLAGADRSLVQRPEVAALLKHQQGPVALSYYDSQRIFDLVYPLLQIFGQIGFSELREEGLDVDISVLPSAGSIRRHLRPSVGVVRRTDAGVESITWQTIPGGSIGSSAPVLAALLLPAVSSARTAARRAQSANNLKQITLAIHNYHDVYRGLPAAYSTGKDGKPLLSWRVHILPFIEQQALYERFHLDEPWDSQHNKQLIPLMPNVYRSPAGQAEPGKTNYLGVAGEKGAFIPPRGEGKQEREQHPVGTGFRDFTDGASNTIMVVEASDEKAVVWTKPEDFIPDDMQPKAGLGGLFPGGFNAGFADGSVRFIRDQISAQTLRRLFQRNDGQVVEIP